jgi:hypothetical protein
LEECSLLPFEVAPHASLRKLFLFIFAPHRTPFILGHQDARPPT